MYERDRVRRNEQWAVLWPFTCHFRRLCYNLTSTISTWRQLNRTDLLWLPVNLCVDSLAIAIAVCISFKNAKKKIIYVVFHFVFETTFKHSDTNNQTYSEDAGKGWVISDTSSDLFPKLLSLCQVGRLPFGSVRLSERERNCELYFTTMNWTSIAHTCHCNLPFLHTCG